METLKLNLEINGAVLKSTPITFNDVEKFGDAEIGTAGKKTVIVDITGNFYNSGTDPKSPNVFINDNPSFAAQSANDYFVAPACLGGGAQRNLILRALHTTDSLPADESGSLALRGGQQAYIKSYFRGIVTNGVTKVQINNIDSIAQGIVRYYEV